MASVVVQVPISPPPCAFAPLLLFCSGKQGDSWERHEGDHVCAVASSSVNPSKSQSCTIPKVPLSPKHIRNCFQQKTGVTRGLANSKTPAGEHYDKENRPRNHNHALIGFTTHADSPKRLAPCELAHTPLPLSRLTTYAPRMRADFTRQHWFLFHLGLYKYKAYAGTFS